MVVRDDEANRVGLSDGVEWAQWLSEQMNKGRGGSAGRG